MLQWLEKLGTFRFHHEMKKFESDYEATGEEREELYQQKINEHLESFCRMVVNIIGTSLLQEALRTSSTRALQIKALVKNPVGFAPTGKPSPVNNSPPRILSHQDSAVSSNCGNHLQAFKPVSERVALSTAQVSDGSPQQEIQLASATPCVWPRLVSAVPPEFSGLDTHLTFPNSVGGFYRYHVQS